MSEDFLSKHAISISHFPLLSAATILLILRFCQQHVHTHYSSASLGFNDLFVSAYYSADFIKAL
jgi:hypothetical protein